MNLIRRLFQTVSELKRYICSQYVEMEHTLAEKRWNLLRYTPKPHSHALNDVIMHKTHWTAAIATRASIICTELGSFNSCFSTVSNSEKVYSRCFGYRQKEVHVYCTFSHFVIDTINW